jgi:hypothetical protein
MGYDLHITRRRQWTDPGDDITSDEWLAYVARDPELTLSAENGPHWATWSGVSELSEPWLDWDDGNVYSKNPDDSLRRKMSAVATALHARVQGDDGEFYDDHGNALPEPKPSLIAQLVSFFRRLLARPRMAPPPDFAVGDHIRDVWGKPAVIVSIDRKATHGLGWVTIRYENGRELTYALGSQFRQSETRHTEP